MSLSQDVAFAALDFDPRNKPDKPGPRPGEAISDWGLAIDAPLRLENPDNHAWDEQADMVIVGLGGAGIAAALQGLEGPGGSDLRRSADDVGQPISARP